MVENKYPAVSTGFEELLPSGEGTVYGACRLPGFGSHEVIVETPCYDLSLPELPTSHVAEVRDPTLPFCFRVFSMVKEFVIRAKLAAMDNLVSYGFDWSFCVTGIESVSSTNQILPDSRFKFCQVCVFLAVLNHSCRSVLGCNEMS